MVARYFVKSRHKTIRQIIAEEAERGGVSVEAITGGARDIKSTKARWLAMYRAYNELGASYSAIGRMTNKDHSTVMHAVKKIMNANKDCDLENILVPCYNIRERRAHQNDG